MQARTVIDQIEVRPNGDVQVRFSKELVNGEVVMHREWHRTRFLPGESVDAQMAAVNQHLQEMGYPPVADYSSITAHCAIAHGVDVQ